MPKNKDDPGRRGRRMAALAQAWLRYPIVNINLKLHPHRPLADYDPPVVVAAP